MIYANLKQVHDAFSVCNSIVTDKNGAAIVKVREHDMDICTGDANKRYIKRMNVQNTDGTCKDFILPLGKTIEILNNYLPADMLEAEFSMDISDDSAVTFNCVQKFSAEKCREDIAGKVATELTNKVVSEGTEDNPRRVLLIKYKYEDLLKEVDDADSWDAAELRDILGKLSIDKQTKNIYISAKQSKVLAVGRNQVSMFDTQDLKYGFILDVNIARAVINTLSKFEDEGVQVYTEGGDRYITFVDEAGESALWVCGSPANRSDLKKIELYTNAEYTYGDYRGACSRIAINTIINAVISSSKEDSQRIDITGVGNPDNAVVLLSNVSAGGSIENQFKTTIFQYRHGENIDKDLSGTIVVKTLKDIISVCKSDYVGISVQVTDKFVILKVEDKYQAESGEVVNVSQHYTLINVA